MDYQTQIDAAIALCKAGRFQESVAIAEAVHSDETAPIVYKMRSLILLASIAEDWPSTEEYHEMAEEMMVKWRHLYPEGCEGKDSAAARTLLDQMAADIANGMSGGIHQAGEHDVQCGCTSDDDHKMTAVVRAEQETMDLMPIRWPTFDPSLLMPDGAAREAIAAEYIVTPAEPMRGRWWSFARADGTFVRFDTGQIVATWSKSGAITGMDGAKIGQCF